MTTAKYDRLVNATLLITMALSNGLIALCYFLK